MSMIVALCTVVVLLVAPSVAQGPGGSALASPCPRVFGYTPPVLEPGLWVGVATLTTEFPLQSLWLNIVLDRPALDFGQLWHWVGNTSTQDNVEYRIENYDLQIYPEQPVIVRFFVRYDPLSTAPRLQAIRLNGKVICDADSDTQAATNGRPVSSNVRQPVPSFSAPKTGTSQNEKPFSSPQNKYPVYQRPVNNSSAGDDAETHNPNTPTSSESVECGVLPKGNITYSEDMTYMKGEIPWVVAVFFETDGSLFFNCVGTLVSDRHVVTAATCAKQRYKEADFMVKFGVHNLNEWWTKDVVTRHIVTYSFHEHYNPNTHENNILIMTMNKRVPFNNFIRPACLWSGDTRLSRVVGATGIVAGWGIQNPKDTRIHNIPFVLRVPIVSSRECRASHAAYHSFTFENTLCAGARNGVGPCFPFSGASLFLLDGDRWRLRALISMSVRAVDKSLLCDLNEYFVYTDAAKYLPWIRNILSQKYID